jgi:hypothetical protein
LLLQNDYNICIGLQAAENSDDINGKRDYARIYLRTILFPSINPAQCPNRQLLAKFFICLSSCLFGHCTGFILGNALDFNDGCKLQLGGPLGMALGAQESYNMAHQRQVLGH